MRWASGVVLPLLLVGCKTTFDFAPVSPTEARRAATELKARNETRFTDLRGHVHASNEAIDVYVRGDGLYQRQLLDIAEPCAVDATCPVQATGAYEIGIQKRVPNGAKIAEWTLGVTLASALVAGNIACFGTDVCADVTKALVGVGDGIVVVGVVGFVIVLIAALSRSGGD